MAPMLIQVSAHLLTFRGKGSFRSKCTEERISDGVLQLYQRIGFGLSCPACGLPRRLLPKGMRVERPKLYRRHC
jgi:hypothetical protein